MKNMAKEYETKVLEINIEEIRQKLLELGAKENKEIFQRRYVYDIDSEDHDWIRLRTNGKKTTLTYKHKKGSQIDETEEIEVEVNDFNETSKIFLKLNFKEIIYQESKRILFELDEIEFTLDTWPKIPTYLEIESSSKEKVLEGLRKLGLENKDCGNLSVKDVYSKYGIDLHKYKELRF